MKAFQNPALDIFGKTAIFLVNYHSYVAAVENSQTFTDHHHRIDDSLLRKFWGKNPRRDFVIAHG